MQGVDEGFKMGSPGVPGETKKTFSSYSYFVHFYIVKTRFLQNAEKAQFCKSSILIKKATQKLRFWGISARHH